MSRPSRRTGAATALATAAALTVTAFGAAPARADRTSFVPISKTWSISGHGYGHGHGLSQYGAQGAALQGLHYAAITRFYYPGTDWGTLNGKVRVLISADTTSDLQVGARSGLSVRDLADDAVWRLPTGHGVVRWRLTPTRGGATAVERLDSSGWHRWRVPGRGTLRSDGQFHASGPLTLYVPSGDGVAARTYRGVLRSVRPSRGATTRDTVNVVTMDQYVRGVVPYEMPASWQPQALRAQAVAARTFAAWQRAQNLGHYYQICDTTACQVYGGVGGEEQSTNAAVEATHGRILTYQGRPAFTQFSASSGGWTSDGGLPYLPAQRDPYDDYPGNSVHSWSTHVSSAALERAHPEIGRLVSLRVTRRDGNGAWNGRVEQLALKGSRATVTMTGDDFRFFYGLRSSWFTLRPTAIMKRWHRIGGARSGLGGPTSGEYAVRGGSAQRFAHGRIFWSRRTGAHELQGPTLAVYRAWGGPASRLGFPVTATMGAPGRGHKARFEGGRIYSSARTGAHVLYGAILGRWSREGAAAGRLGFPTSSVHRVPGGLSARFQHGRLTWHRSSGAVTARRR